MSARRWLRIALTSLVALMFVSAGIVVAPALLAPAGRAHTGLPPGTVLALVKICTLGFVFARIRKADVYALQWSSMFILLVVGEGLVRATSDPPSTAGLGLVEAVVAFVYFVAVLAILRPIKQRARAGRVEKRPPEMSDDPSNE